MRTKHLILFSFIFLNIFLGCGKNKNTARRISSNDFSAFGSDPVRGDLPVKKGDYICADITVTTQGTAREIYLQYSYNYYNVNCFTETNRKARVDFRGVDSDKLSKYIGQTLHVYGVVKRVDIKRPEHACDYAWATIYLKDTEIESGSNK